MPASLKEKIYYKLPIFLQDFAFSLYGFYLSKKTYNTYFFDHLEELKDMEWWSAEKIADYQNKKIHQIVNHAYETVPFYKKWYDELGVDVREINSISDLNKLPILTKKLAKENQKDLISSDYDRKSLHRGLTSGTTGTPLNVYLSKRGLAFQWAIWWRHKARFGLGINDRHLTFGARVPISQTQSKPPYWRNDFFGNRVYLSTFHLSKHSVRDIVKYLNEERFEFFTGYPSAMYVLAALMDEHGLVLSNRPRYVVTGSDALLPKYEALISKVFGAPVTEQYGMAEFAGNLSKCECGSFHVDYECCYVEAKPLENTEQHSLIMTGWGNPAMPFIRYEVGDLGIPSKDVCSCGRASSCFSSIDGRLEDYVVTPDGRKIIGMNQVFEYADNVKEIQLYQRKTDEVEFRIVAGEEFGAADKDALIREFRRRAGPEIRISFSLVDELERSQTGKLKAVISDIS